MANKKIVVLKLRELIYTGIFLFFGVILILLLIAMFSGKRPEKNADTGASAGDAKNSPAPVANDASAEDKTAPGKEQGSAVSNASAKDNADSGKKPDSEEDSLTQTFRPGIYTTDFTLSGKTFTLQMLAEADRIVSVDLLSLDMADGTSGDEYIATMYPLMEPALTTLSECLAEGLSLSDITFSVENQYTGALLKEAMEMLLKKASPDTEETD